MFIEVLKTFLNGEKGYKPISKYCKLFSSWERADAPFEKWTVSSCE